MSTALAEQIERLSIPVPFSGCWIWTASLSPTGYGQLTHKGKHMQAHRASFEGFKKPLLEGEWVLHKCDVRSCVNPDHLYTGTPVDNRQDMIKRSRWAHPFKNRTACSNGHSYEETGFRFATDGSRVCLRCQRDAQRAYRRKINVTTTD